jgi:Ca2+-binding RTX toxin-like protein
VIEEKAGNDLVLGGMGDDRVDGDTGDDRLRGQQRSDDTINGGRRRLSAREARSRTLSPSASLDHMFRVVDRRRSGLLADEHDSGGRPDTVAACLRSPSSSSAAASSA